MAIPIPVSKIVMPWTEGVYIVGGFVRDIVLGKTPTDVDILVDGHAERFASKMAENLSARVLRLGKPGRWLYRIVSKGMTFDISPMFAATIQEDLACRDFTINAMAYDVESDRIVDPAAGMADIAKRAIRMVSEDSFKNDPIRLLRAFRISAELGFAIAPQTMETVGKQAFRLTDSAGERIRNELLRLFRSSVSLPAVRQMARTGLLDEIFPGISDLSACSQNRHHDFDVFAHTLKAYHHLEHLLNNPGRLLRGCAADHINTMDENRKALLKLALLLHDTGKPATRHAAPDGIVHFYGHAKTSAQLAREAGRRIKLSNKELAYVDAVIRHHNRPLHLFQLKRKNQLTPRALARFFLSGAHETPDILVHAIADHLGKKMTADHSFVVFSDELIHSYLTDHLKKLQHSRLITGCDLIDTLGLTPSPEFKAILDQVELRRLSGDLGTRAEALAWAANYIRRETDSNS